MKTLSQFRMQQALDLVREVVGKPEQVRTIYGNLCHEFPVLVRTCGLCQAIAFCADKAQSDENARAEAYRLLLKHMSARFWALRPTVKAAQTTRCLEKS
jgi:CRISPR-associated protein Cmr5